MDYIRLIDEYIESLKKYNDEEYLIKINSFDLSLKCDTVEECEKIDINKLIKNLILSCICDLELEEFKEKKGILENTDFNYLFEEFKKFKIPKMIWCWEPVVDEKGNIIGITCFGKKSFKLFGVEEFYIDSNSDSTTKTNGEFIINYRNKKVKEAKEKIINEDFLNDIVNIDKQDKENLITSIFNILEEKWYLEDSNNELKKLKEDNPSFSHRDIRIITKNDKSNFICFIVKLTKDFVKNLENSLNEEKNKRTSTIKKLEKIKVYLNDLNINNLDKIDFNLLNKIDSNMYKYIFEDLFKKQKETYDRVYYDYDMSKKMLDANYLKQLFSKFNIDYYALNDDIKELLVNSKQIENLEKNMELLKIEKDDITYELILFLLNTHTKIIREYVYYINSNIVSKKMLLNNLDLFSNKDFIEKCMLMQNNNLSLLNKIYSDDILLKDKEDLIFNNKLLKIYKRNNEDNNYIYLYDSYNFDILDFLIENGLNATLLDNIFLSKLEVEKFIKRVLICQNLDIPLYTKSGNVNRSFLLGNNFYSTDDDLDDYILKSIYENEELIKYIKDNKRNIINYNINEIEAFIRLEDNYLFDELYYDINGIIISRAKVMRNLSLFYNNNMINEDTILASIIYNTNLSDEEIRLVKESIFNTKKKKL